MSILHLSETVDAVSVRVASYRDIGMNSTSDLTGHFSRMEISAAAVASVSKVKQRTPFASQMLIGKLEHAYIAPPGPNALLVNQLKL